MPCIGRQRSEGRGQDRRRSPGRKAGVCGAAVRKLGTVMYFALLGSQIGTEGTSVKFA